MPIDGTLDVVLLFYKRNMSSCFFSGVYLPGAHRELHRFLLSILSTEHHNQLLRAGYVRSRRNCRKLNLRHVCSVSDSSSALPTDPSSLWPGQR